MNKLIKLRDRIFPDYSRVPLIFCGVTQFFAYFVTSKITLFERVEVDIPLDAKVEIIPWWIVIYVLAYLYWIWGYVYVCRASRDECLRFCRADYISKAICALFFIFMPTGLVQKPVEGAGVFEWMLRAIYAIDEPRNLFPSMHCLMSWLICRRLGAIKGVDIRLKIGAYAFTILVFFSTIFTGQHLIIDIPGGVLVAEITMLVSYKLPLRFGRTHEKHDCREA